MSEFVLETKGISINFGGVRAVDKFSIQVKKGETIAIIGPNGAGKTTIFNIISKIYQPDEGQIILDGVDFTEKSQVEASRAGISRTFQNTRLFSGLTVLENVKVALDHNGKNTMIESMLLLPRHWKHEKETTAKAMDCLKLLNLDQYASLRPDKLPYGIQRRVEIARALVSNPKVLFLDEPAAGLNPEEVFQLVDFIKEIQQKYPEVAVLVIEHRMDLVMNLAEYIYVQDFGKTIAQGVPSEIINNPLVLKAYLGEEE